MIWLDAAARVVLLDPDVEKYYMSMKKPHIQEFYGKIIKDIMKRNDTQIDYVELGPHFETASKIRNLPTAHAVRSLAVLQVRKGIGSTLKEEIALSDKLEKMLGKETYMQIFFTDEERRRYKSAHEKYQVIKNSSDPMVKRVLSDLDPQKIYDSYKYKVRGKVFNAQGVEELLSDKTLPKKQRLYLIYNLDKVKRDEDSPEDFEGSIEINYKEWILAKFEEIIDD
jgi:hypothetical protein